MPNVTIPLTVKTCYSVKLNENELTQQTALQFSVGWMSPVDRRTFSQIVKLNRKFASQQ